MAFFSPVSADEKDLLEKLKFVDTPSVTNVVATYPKDKEGCLGLYDPWECDWYTDATLKCIYPDLGRTVGFAVTCVFGTPASGYNRLGFSDLLRAIEEMPKPVVLIIKQDLPEKIKIKSGLSGGNMTTALKSLGVVAVISDGPSRDIDEMRPMKVQYMLTGVCAGHGDYSVKAINVPVSVCSMDVAPGEIIHMDENGAVKFPREYLPQVVEMAGRLQQIEKERQAKMRETSSAEQLTRILAGFEDGK
jgi:4-hydroxy-4-methyl-2-oxoglutarate aldolase